MAGSTSQSHRHGTGNPTSTQSASAARNHPLFGVLDFIATRTTNNVSAIEAMDKRKEKLEESAIPLQNFRVNLNSC
jgi:hypothetical protein